MSLRLIRGGPDTPTQAIGLADYVWVTPHGKLESKTRVIPVGADANKDFVPVIERWTTHWSGQGFILSPCHYLPDPLRPQPSFITLCEVRDREDRCLGTNHRKALRDTLGRDQTVWWGFRQHYELGHPNNVEPISEADRFLVAERHLGACLDAGLMVHSADVGSSFKVGYRRMPSSVDPDAPTALVVADHLWIARYLLEKVARERGLVVFGGNHSKTTVFFSTERMRALAPDAVSLADTILRLGTALAEDGDSSWLPSLRARVVSPSGGFECLEDYGPLGNMDPYRIAERLFKAIQITDI